GLDHDGIGACRIEGSEKRVSPAFLQFLVDRLATWADEFLKARVASTDWRELNKALGTRRNGPRRRLSAQHQGHRDVFAGDGVTAPSAERRPRSMINLRTAAAKAAASRVGTSSPVIPDTTIPWRPPVAPATTGSPLACASSSAMPKASLLAGQTKRSAEARRSAIDFWSRGPIQLTRPRSAARALETSLRAGPSPITS